MQKGDGHLRMYSEDFRVGGKFERDIDVRCKLLYTGKIASRIEAYLKRKRLAGERHPFQHSGRGRVDMCKAGTHHKQPVTSLAFYRPYYRHPVHLLLNPRVVEESFRDQGLVSPRRKCISTDRSRA